MTEPGSLFPYTYTRGRSRLNESARGCTTLRFVVAVAWGHTVRPTQALRGSGERASTTSALKCMRKLHRKIQREFQRSGTIPCRYVLDDPGALVEVVFASQVVLGFLNRAITIVDNTPDTPSGHPEPTPLPECTWMFPHGSPNFTALGQRWAARQCAAAPKSAMSAVLESWLLTHGIENYTTLLDHQQRRRRPNPTRRRRGTRTITIPSENSSTPPSHTHNTPQIDDSPANTITSSPTLDIRDKTGFTHTSCSLPVSSPTHNTTGTSPNNSPTNIRSDRSTPESPSSMPPLVSPSSSSHTSSLLDSPPHSLQQSPDQHETHHVSPDRSPRVDPEETVEPGAVRSPRGSDTEVENTNWIDDDKGPPSSPELSDNTGQDEDVQSDATEDLGLGKFFQPTEDEDEAGSDDIESNDDSQVSEDDQRRWHRPVVPIQRPTQQ